MCSRFLAVVTILASSCRDDLFPKKPNDPELVFDVLWKEVDRNYSSFDRTSISWDSVYNVYRPFVNKSTSSPELFNVLDKILTLLRDGHLNLHAPHGTGGNIDYFASFADNPIVAQPEGPYFEHFQQINRAFGVGKFARSKLSYLRIKTFEGDKVDFEKIDSILNTLDRNTGLIIDVRSNYGGSISNAQLIASRFTTSENVAYEYRVRNGARHSDFTPWHKVNLVGSPHPLWAERQVAVLTNRGSFSATEWFVLFMKAQPQVTIIGDTTGGGGAIPISRELPNGWIVRIPNTQTRLPSGDVFQKIGIPPDIPVWITQDDQENGIDGILDAAIALF